MPEENSHRAIKSRLRDWWHGEDPVALEEPEPELSVPEPPPMADARTGPDHDMDDRGMDGRAWTADSIAAVQMVCGTGSSIPGGEAFAAASIRHMALRETMSVVDYGAQLGVLARVIAQKTGAWVDAYEPVPLLAGEATRLAELNRVGKKVTVSTCDLLRAPVKTGSRDAVIAVETLHRSTEHAAHVQNIARMLKLGGRLLMVDFFRQPDASTSTATERWRADEAVRGNIPTLDGMRASMESVRIRIQVSEDITSAYCGHVTAGLRTLAQQLSMHPPESAMRRAVLREVQFWGSRLQVLQSGEVSVQRLSATLGR